MTYKLVAFTPTSDPVLTDYVKNQLIAISNSFPDLAVEQANENDPRLLYSWYPDRFPAFVLFTDSVRKAAIHAKLNDADIIDWISFNLG